MYTCFSFVLNTYTLLFVFDVFNFSHRAYTAPKTSLELEELSSGLEENVVLCLAPFADSLHLLYGYITVVWYISY